MEAVVAAVAVDGEVLPVEAVDVTNTKVMAVVMVAKAAGEAVETNGVVAMTSGAMTAAMTAVGTKDPPAVAGTKTKVDPEAGDPVLVVTRVAGVAKVVKAATGVRIPTVKAKVDGAAIPVAMAVMETKVATVVTAVEEGAVVAL